MHKKKNFWFSSYYFSRHNFVQLYMNIHKIFFSYSFYVLNRSITLVDKTISIAVMEQ